MLGFLVIERIKQTYHYTVYFYLTKTNEYEYLTSIIYSTEGHCKNL